VVFAAYEKPTAEGTISSLVGANKKLKSTGGIHMVSFAEFFFVG
jgi:hypothetical protein